MKILIDIPDEWRARIEGNIRPNSIECEELVASIWKGEIILKDEWIPVCEGQWIKHKYNGIVFVECSECHYSFLESHLLRNSYCPNCGIKMVRIIDKYKK